MTPSTGITPGGFALFFDAALTELTPYHEGSRYVSGARRRIDDTFQLLRGAYKGARVLDIGASPFYLLDKALRAGASKCDGVFYADQDHPLRGREKIFSKAGVIGLHHVDVTADSLPFPDDEFDLVFACQILEHLDRFPGFLAAEIHRVLRPGGSFCVTVPNVCRVANIAKLLLQQNVFMKYREDVTGRHKHEYTLRQLEDYMAFVGVEVVKSGFISEATYGGGWKGAVNRMVVATPLLRRYGPIAFSVGRMPPHKRAADFAHFPDSLFSSASSTEE